MNVFNALMKALLPLLLLLIIAPEISAQDPCVYDEEGNCIARGKTKSVTIKTSYGGKISNTLRTGQWTFYNPDGVTVCLGVYTIKNNVSYRDGEWLYYNAEGIVMMKRNYIMGACQLSVVLDTGTWYHGSDTIQIHTDSLSNAYVSESHGTIRFSYKTSLPGNVFGDPAKFAKKQNELNKVQRGSNSSDSFFLEQHPAAKALMHVNTFPNSPANIIQNGDFEMKSEKMGRQHVSQIEINNDPYARYWGSSNETPDIYKIKDNCYAGFRVMGVNYEVLRNELRVPLQAGKEYCLQFKVKLKQENAMAFNGISVTLSAKPMFFPSIEEGRKNGIVFQSHPDIVLGCRENWMVLSGRFTANGGEQYLYIGNFTEAADLKLYKVYEEEVENPGEIYYLIDDVVLVEIGSDSKCPCNINTCELKIADNTDHSDTDSMAGNFTNPKVGQSIILKNIRFETASWELLPESYETLDSLIDFMNTYPGMKVEISGHTDNRGKSRDNIELSQNRANAVVAYLIENGISEERLTAIGFGQEEPVDSNDTESGRFNNRRVEFKITDL